MSKLRARRHSISSRLRLPRRTSSLGQSVAEFALAVPIILILLGGALDMGRLFYARVSIENAAREGAFFGATNPRCDTSARTYCADPNNADWRVRNEATGLGTLNVSFACSQGGTPVAITSCEAGDTYEAAVATDFTLATPLLMPLFGSSMTIDARARAVVLDDAYDPNASPAPMQCSVPDLIGLTSSDAADAWEAAGFDAGNYFDGTMKNHDIVATQSIAAGLAQLCLTTVITVSE